MAGATIRVDSIFQVDGYRCRCGHEWVPKSLRSKELPKVCPKCKSPYWNLEYQNRRTPPGAQKELAE